MYYIAARVGVRIYCQIKQILAESPDGQSDGRDRNEKLRITSRVRLSSNAAPQHDHCALLSPFVSGLETMHFFSQSFKYESVNFLEC